MPSSISNSDMHPDSKVYERPVPSLQLAGLIALLIFLGGMIAWELWVRSEGVQPSYRNSDGLWAEHRRKIDQGAGDGWVFTGSSRTLFNVQVPVWTELDGREPVQLAMEGSSPLAVVEGLAEDEDFTGNLLIGVAPGLFFSGFTYRADAFKRYETETPTQWMGQQISQVFEPYLAFYTFDFALPKILERQDWPQREGVRSRKDVRKLSNMERNRNTRMWDKVVNDQAYQELAKEIWAQGWRPMAERPPEEQERAKKGREQQIERAVAAINKLQERGVTVVLVQMPYSGHYAVREPDAHPRAESWDILLERTGAIGLHFEDHPEMQAYDLPEWSHMKAEDADRFTADFYRLVQRELAQ